MAWNPENNVVDTRFLGKNILQFVKDADADALRWANGGANLKEFQQFSESIANRAKPVFPSLAIVADSNATDFDSDLLTTAYEITLEAMIYSAQAEVVSGLAKKYAYALESMLLNMPKAAFLTGVSGVTQVRLNGIETSFDELKTNDAQNGFMQMFQTKAIFYLYASAY